MPYGVFVHEENVEIHKLRFIALVSHNVYPAHIGRLSEGEFKIVAYTVTVCGAKIAKIIPVEAI